MKGVGRVFTRAGHRRGLPFVESALQDLRYGLRVIRRQRGFAAMAIVTLALGTGANAAVFTMINTALLRPLPVERPDEIVALETLGMFPTFSYPNYRDIRDRADVFDGLIGYRIAQLSVSHSGVNERLWGYLVTGNYFEVLGVKPVLGRLISQEDDRTAGGHPVVVASYNYWRRRFGGDPGIIGRNIIINGRGYTVVGIAQEGFQGTEIVTASDLFIPMTMQAPIDVGPDLLNDRAADITFVQGRLKPGVTVARAQAGVAAVARQLEREYPDVNENTRIGLARPGLMGNFVRGPVLGFSALLMACVGLVLLLACTNLANLLLARGADRRREIAVRLAIGASRGRVLRQLLTESLLLALTGGAIGLALAYWIAKLAVAFQPAHDLPVTLQLFVDYRVVVFTGVVSLATGLMFGLLPAWHGTNIGVAAALKEETSFGRLGRGWLKNGLIVGQVALSLLLLIGGGLMVRALQRVATMDLGFVPGNAVEVSFDLRLQGYDSGRGRAFQKELLERARRLPDVQRAGVADMIPVDIHFSRGRLYVEGQPVARPSDAPRTLLARVSPGYFEAMNVRLVRGRDFTEFDDDKGRRVAIVNETFARRFWPGGDPIGRRFALAAGDAAQIEIVGVARDGKYTGLNEAPTPFVYRPLWQSYVGATDLVVRTSGDPQHMIATLRRLVNELDPAIPFSNARSLSDRVAFAMLPARIAAAVLGGFGLLALALAAIGIYGVMSYSVAMRTREIGIRMSLGAQKRDVLALVMRQGVAVTVAGVAIGLLAALIVTRLAERVLFGASATDPIAYGTVTVLLIGVAMLACYLPARRATAADPLVALRHE